MKNNLLFYLLLTISIVAVCFCFMFAGIERGYKAIGGEVITIGLPLIITRIKILGLVKENERLKNYNKELKKLI